jgi:hypothetical protein
MNPDERSSENAQNENIRKPTIRLILGIHLEVASFPNSCRETRAALANCIALAAEESTVVSRNTIP